MLVVTPGDILYTTNLTYYTNTLSTMVSPTTLINKLFSQLIEPILLYAAEQWILYVHPRKVDKLGTMPIYASPTSIRRIFGKEWCILAIILMQPPQP